MLAQIVRLVTHAQSTRAPIQALADRIAAVFAPAVRRIALVPSPWYVVGPEPRLLHALIAFVTVTVIACPCAMGLATPTALIVGMGRGASLGVLVKSGEALERAAEVDTVVLDKTGTVTEGRPAVVGVTVLEGTGLDEQAALRMAAPSRRRASTRIAPGHRRLRARRGSRSAARASSRWRRGRRTRAGRGRSWRVGTARGSRRSGRTSRRCSRSRRRSPPPAATPSGLGRRPAGRRPSPCATGTPGRARSDRAAARDGAARRHAHGRPARGGRGGGPGGRRRRGARGALPRRTRSRRSTQLRRRGARWPWWATASTTRPRWRAPVGIAVGTATDVAIEAADVALLRAGLDGVPTVLALARKTMRTIRREPLLGVRVQHHGHPASRRACSTRSFGVLLSPVIASGAMAMSSVSVVANSLRLKTFAGQ